MRLSLNVRHHGPQINLPVSRAQRTFGPGVYNELTAGLGPDAVAYSTVTNSLRRRQFNSILVDPPEEPGTIVIVQAILDVLGHCSFAFIRELAHLTCIPAPTVHRQSMQSLGFVVKHLRRVPYTLTPTQKNGPSPSLN
jgi:hypothetical protein